MNTKNNALMRSIWGEQMAKDGFIWKYRVWIRIDFEKEWYAAIVPRSVGQGYCVDIGYDVDLLDSLTPEILRQRLHLYACPSAFELCRYLDHRPQGVQMNLVSEETFRE